ncbi:MAG: HNH endonuclease [Inquilinus sp.]|nr:HNH endonuclease [Inquilinus sp.]
MPARDIVREQLIVALEMYVWKGVQHGYPVSEDELDAVVALYDAYDAAGGAPGDPLKGPNLDQALRTAIQNAYDFTRVGRRLASIRETLLKDVERCPVCGISAPRTLDHYLPKASFHPLAIYVRNLIPLCADCNQLKSAAASNDPAEQFIHPYFEELPNGRFLRTEVAIADGGLVADFGLDTAVEMPALLAARLKFQLNRLRLNERYAQEINTYLSSHTTALQMCFDALGTDGVRDYLDRQATVEFSQFHGNYWRPVLLLALAGHDDFCAGGFRDVLPQAPALPPEALAAVAQ